MAWLLDRVLTGLGKRVIVVERLLHGPVTLIASVNAGYLEIKQWRTPRLRLDATLERRRGDAQVEVQGDTAKLTLIDGKAVLQAPVHALAAAVDAGSLRVTETPTPLRYAALHLNTASAQLHAKLAPGGGALLHADASAARLRLEPSEPGDYWLHIMADASNVKITFKGNKRVEAETRRLEDSRLNLPKSTPEANVKIKITIDADSSKILIE